MFSIKFLHEIRSFELQAYLDHFDIEKRILEIGGGTGAQAKQLSELGFDIESIDLESSNYANDVVYNVRKYDGYNIPFDDNSFDIVFSSNVLEHVAHINEFHKEMKRVLRPGGVCIHVMPTGIWSFWTIVTHYLSTIEQIYRNAAIDPAKNETVASKGKKADSPSCWLWRRARLFSKLVTNGSKELWHTLRYNRGRLFPPRHGEYGTVFTEVVTFSKYWWMRHFRKNGYHILEASPMGLFYTGYMFLGSRWPLVSRRRWARLLGSACIIYKVYPK